MHNALETCFKVLFEGPVHWSDWSGREKVSFKVVLLLSERILAYPSDCGFHSLQICTFRRT